MQLQLKYFLFVFFNGILFNASGQQTDFQSWKEVWGGYNYFHEITGYFGSYPEDPLKVEKVRIDLMQIDDRTHTCLLGLKKFTNAHTIEISVGNCYKISIEELALLHDYYAEVFEDITVFSKLTHLSISFPSPYIISQLKKLDQLQVLDLFFPPENLDLIAEISNLTALSITTANNMDVSRWGKNLTYLKVNGLGLKKKCYTSKDQQNITGFNALENLKTVSLQGELIQFPTEIYDAPNLMHIHVQSGYRMLSIPNPKFELHHLRTLIVKAIGKVELPSDWSHFKSLKTLVAITEENELNLINNLPTGLTHLWLEAAEGLNNIPYNLSKLKSLEYITLIGVNQKNTVKKLKFPISTKELSIVLREKEILAAKKIGRRFKCLETINLQNVLLTEKEFEWLNNLPLKSLSLDCDQLIQFEELIAELEVPSVIFINLSYKDTCPVKQLVKEYNQKYPTINFDYDTSKSWNN